jgi:hypothetical protein
MLFGEIILVYTENHTKPMHANTALAIVKAAS